MSLNFGKATLIAFYVEICILVTNNPSSTRS
jgi:hypothetical protein